MTWRKPRITFAVLRFGSDIRRCALTDAINTGISFDVDIQGWVSEYELREAAVFGRYNFIEFMALPWQERATAIAHYRLSKLVELHGQDAITRAVKARAKRRGRRHG